APPPGRSDRRLPLVAVLACAVALVGVVVGLALLRDNGGGQRASGGASTTQQAARERERARKDTAAAPKAQAQAAQQPAPAATTDPAALNDRGFQLIQQGDYAGAVEPLRASVQAYRQAGRTGELGYYFALFNLGVALNRSGDPGAAITILRERLRNPNQRGTVERELAAAAQKLGADKQGSKVDSSAKGNDAR
ncbi:MAG: eukaryotic-like serine/threonine-protein kinase, partial [Solirubrobacteraceae bacterium]|nr:eukaryotic-like serine/threonine-protein kinase [Solirubrobacteraceae bacterium]